LFPADGTDVTTLVRKADSAMYSAKRSGKNRYHLYDEELDRLADARRLVLTSMAGALDNGELRLWYQPKVNLTSGQIIGAEALVRWQHPERGLLAPGEFLPEIERTDLVVRLGDWVIGEALAQGGAWRKLGLDLTISVNVAARQLQEQGFFEKLETALAAYPIGTQSLLQLELIEASTLDEIDAIRTIMEKCKALGVRFAIDDFGTGQSSLNYFRHLPADTLKIDGSFVRAMMDNPDDYLLVRGIVAIAGAFNREVVAEGVATHEQSAALLAMGCRVVQGYAVARPMPAEEFVNWCAAYPPDPRWRKLAQVMEYPAARRA
jgi:EAL domain-containing protein (putative c-di-GMP-specific phosphodiesterase class I)